MDSNGGTPSKRVELEGGQWAEVRRVTGSVMRHVREKAQARGYEDVTLETLDGLPLVITAWSVGDAVTADAVEERLTELDILRCWATAKGVDLPNPSPPSSDGTPTKGQTRAKRRSNG